jgi:hypothetical protein
MSKMCSSRDVYTQVCVIWDILGYPCIILSQYLQFTDPELAEDEDFYGGFDDDNLLDMNILGGRVEEDVQVGENSQGIGRLAGGAANGELVEDGGVDEGAGTGGAEFSGGDDGDDNSGADYSIFWPN